MKLRTRTLIGMLAALVMATDLFGQAQITTKKEKIKTFTTSTTKIVLSGDDLFDNALQDCISSSWTVSPYEFCTMAEFEALKTNPALYFLIPVKEQFHKETDPGITFLALVKGGVAADKSVGDMLELTSFPLKGADAHFGKEIAFLPFIIRFIQDQALGKTGSEFKAYSSGININPKTFARLWNKQIHFSNDDISPEVNTDAISAEDPDIFFVDDNIDIFEDGDYNAVVSFVVAPMEPEKGSVCYKMLIGADTHELYYFKKHKISAANGAGFLNSDMKLITGIRKKK
ncbi:MAG: hypothetical protein ACI399_07105 [Candidatus Cryptobacteroides sp.]